VMGRIPGGLAPHTRGRGYPLSTDSVARSDLGPRRVRGNDPTDFPEPHSQWEPAVR